MVSTFLMVGASGATGRLLVKELLARGHRVKAVVRSPERLQQFIGEHAQLELTTASINEMNHDDLAHHLQDCDAAFSCLGHNLTFKGLFGKPRRLVTDSIRKICMALNALASPKPIRVILMNTVGNANRDIPEYPPFSQRLVISILRALLPPLADNEQAADYLRLHVGTQSQAIEWCAVRPDSLTNEDAVSPYELVASPTRNAIFNPGASSRINVAHAMADLATNDASWQTWKGRMPVLYNTAG